LWDSLAEALANVGLRKFHTVDAALIIIAWQFGSVLLLMALDKMQAWRTVAMGENAGHIKQGLSQLRKLDIG
jgi:hypothetical protein